MRHRPHTHTWRTGIALLAAAIGSLCSPGRAPAQTYPTRPVKIVVPFPAGGSTDAISRILAQKLSESLGQQFIVENRAGAGGNIGIGIVAHAAADGYTVLMVSSAFVVNPGLYATPGYDPFKDFAPVTDAGFSPNVVIVNPSLSAKTIGELVTLIKANPGKFSYATPGFGTTADLAGALFRLSFGLDIVNVPYNGGSPAIAATLSGETPILFSSIPPVIEPMKSGSLRGLAVTSPRRVAAMPELPTLAELGVTGQESDVIHGVLVPSGTSRTIIDILHREIVKAVALPDVRQRFATFAFEPSANTPEEFAAEIRIQIAKWGKVIKDANIKVE